MKAHETTELGMRLEELKYNFRLSNNQLGKIAGVSGQAISDIITGTTDSPKVNILKNIAKDLGVSLIWLITGEGSMVNDQDVSLTSSVNTDQSMMQFLRDQIKEKDKVINRLLDRLGKRKGVSNQAVLFAEA